MECFVINNFNLAAMLCSEWEVPAAFPAQAVASNEFEALREKLPEWMLVLCSNGGPRLPEEKIAYEEEALQDICAMLHLQLHDGGHMEGVFQDELLRPWGSLKKFCLTSFSIIGS